MRRFLEQQEAIRKAMEGPLRYIEQHGSAIEKMKRIATSTRMSDYADQFAVLQVKARLPEPGAVSALTKEALEGFSAKASLVEMQKYLATNREIYEAMDRAALPYKTLSGQLAVMSKYYDFTSASLHSLEFDRIGELVAASAATRFRLGLVTAAFERRNANLLAELSRPEGRLASAPPFVSEMPAAALFIHARAVRSITPHEQGEPAAEQGSAEARVEIAATTVEFLEVNLPLLKPEFLIQYHGTKVRAKDRGPDWSTQGGASMRKLLKGVLHTAAPNELVLPWAQKHGKALDRNGRPTRATKVEWLCQFYPVLAYVGTVKVELMAALRVIDVLDESQHVDDTEEFADQYDECMLCVEVAVRHILTIWKARNLMN